MDDIRIRYGEELQFTVQTDDLDATELNFYVGKPGQDAVIVAPGTLTENGWVVTVEPTQTRIPLGQYNYQLNVVHTNNSVDKYPEPTDCEEDGLPKFYVHEALDETEVVS